jgi:tetratricopeptide (TPR) repeat protein
MKARLARALAVGTLALLPALAVSDAAADPPAIPSVGSAQEDEAYALYREEKYLTARTKAEEILARDPGSVVGHYVLGSVLREAEGSLPRSMAHLREAKRLHDREQRSAGGGPPPRPPDKGQVRLAADVLWSLQSTARLMEQYELQLALLDERDRTYAPPMPASHAWPLMKLRRFAEAREYARRGLAMGTPWQEITALNALCAIDGEDHQRQGHYDSCKRALEWATAHPGMGSLAVHAHNAALGALALLRFDEAERLALSGTRKLERTPSNPFRLLALLYAGEGRADDSVAALREMQRWCAAQPPQYRDQKSAETDGVIAAVLLAAGDGETGLRFVTRALDRPDRRAVTSSHPEQSLGGGAVLRRALRRLSLEQEAERAAAAPLLGPTGMARIEGVASSLGARAAEWADEERAIAVLSDDERLVLSLRPYTDGGLEPLPPWMIGDLVGLLGPGVTAAALARAREADADMPEAAPYFDAVEAEIALARHDPRRARSLAEGTLDRLPRAEVMLRARVAAVGAEAAARAGELGPSLVLFEKALALDPGVVRRLGLALPARVESLGGGLPARVAALLRRSPRLSASSAGFVVRVEGDDRRLRACLLTPSAAQLGCGEVRAAPGEAVDDLASRLVHDFHRAAFTMKFSLTPTDLRSLDGSTTMAQGSAREALRGILHEGEARDR